MDTRWKSWRELAVQNMKTPDGVTDQERQHRAEIMRDGKDGEFWTHVTHEIEKKIRAAESRFLDTLAPSYEDYVQLWAKRHALIGVLSIPEPQQ